MAAAGAGRRPRVLLGVTGSVAAVKAPQLAHKFASAGCDVRVVLTAKGAHFWKLTETYHPPSWASVATVPGATADRPISPVAARVLASSCSAPETLGDGFPASGVQAVLRDADEWDAYSTVKEDPVLHIELRRWADVLVVAPLSANTLGKLAHGMCDDLLSCLFRAWDPSRPALLCPAMNTLMWEHPFTARDKSALLALPCVTFVEPAEAVLACGDKGAGALADVDDIVRAALGALKTEASSAARGGAATDEQQ